MADGVRVEEARLYSISYHGNVGEEPEAVYKAEEAEWNGGITRAFKDFSYLLPLEPKLLVLVLSDGREVSLRHDYWGRDGDGPRGSGAAVVFSQWPQHGN